jgi:hypothetical protein
MLQKHCGSHFPQCHQALLAIPFGCQTCFKTSSLQFHFQFGKQGKITGG